MDGFFQLEIHHSAVKYQRAVESGSKKVVGVNTYVEDGDGPTIDLHKIRKETEEEAHRAMAELRTTRDEAQVKSCLEAIRSACGSDANLIERFVAAAHAGCTLGEIASILRSEFGEFQEPNIL
jgi:methylmalonyl-CoA mutase N-terminal domain/subunit